MYKFQTINRWIVQKEKVMDSANSKIFANHKQCKIKSLLFRILQNRISNKCNSILTRISFRKKNSK